MRNFLAKMFVLVMIVIGSLVAALVMIRTGSFYIGIIPAVIFSAIAMYGFGIIDKSKKEREEK
jgi:FtsH-binding integral membrane protein